MRNRSSRGPSVSAVWVLIGVNLLLFIFTLIWRNEMILRFGLIPAFVIREPWTLLTSMFIHAGIWHIIVNMLTLYFFGSYLCRLIGTKRFLLVYFCGGILGSVFFVVSAFLPLPGFLSTSITSIAVGASGAIFALGGVLAVLTPRLRVFIFPIPVPMPLWIAVIGGCLILSFMPGIAWQAHLGGLVFGLVWGGFFRRRMRYYA